MSKIEELEHLNSERAKISAMLALANDADDIVARMTFDARLKSVELRLNEIQRIPENSASIALMFEGRPVEGQRSIDARFASKAVSLFQELVSKAFASLQSVGIPGARGQVPYSDISSLRIVDVARGSFGFVLEEQDIEQSNMVPTAAKKAVEEAVAAIEALASDDYQLYSEMLDKLNPRTLTTAKELFSHLHANEAAMKTETPSHKLSLTLQSVDRAHERLRVTDIQETEGDWIGVLLGIAPVARTFEFRRDGTREIVSGAFGTRVSQDFLERIERDGLVLGHRFQMKVGIKVTTKPNGVIMTTYTAIDLIELT
jgi:hypothetical protein